MASGIIVLYRVFSKIVEFAIQNALYFIYSGKVGLHLQVSTNFGVNLSACGASMYGLF